MGGDAGDQRGGLARPGAALAGAARLAITPAGHPQGYAECFDLFVADTYAAIGGEQPDGLPSFADGERSARVIDAVLRSAAQDGAWVDVADAPTASSSDPPS